MTQQATLPVSSAVDSLECLEDVLRLQLHGRVRRLRLYKRAQGLILQGQAATYYAKQLAQQLVMKATSLPLLCNEIEVV